MIVELNYSDIKLYKVYKVTDLYDHEQSDSIIIFMSIYNKFKTFTNFNFFDIHIHMFKY